ncbi:hypothetical protein ALC60_00082 [Trachymyrmex zeteki]|nr:hypothetical protein ALC60_00082 [Trachymyrmex zeteki]
MHCFESFLLPDRKDISHKELCVCFQSSRLEDQRSSLPAASTLQNAEEERGPRANGKTQSGSTVPEEDLFALIQRFQAGRMEDQRASGPGKAC